MAIRDFSHDIGNGDLYLPFREMRINFGKVCNVADVISSAVLRNIIIIQFHAHSAKKLNGLKDGNTVRSATPQVIGLTAGGLLEELKEEPRNIAGVDLIPYLLPFIAIDGILSRGRCAGDDIGKVAM